MRALLRPGGVALVCALTACRSVSSVEVSRPTTAVPVPTALPCLSVVDRAVSRGLAERVLPGGVLAIGRRTGLIHLRAVGRLSFEPDAASVRVDTVYDLASVTKAVATSMLAMALVDQGRLDLDAPTSSWLPEWSAGDRGRVRVRDLLAHTACLREWAPLYKEVRNEDALLHRISEMDLICEPGAKSVYSDLGPIVLGAVLERVAGMSLAESTRRLVFEPLEMSDTSYQPSSSLRERSAPTGESRWRGQFLRGVVHDENAYRMDGVAGHAGLFSTASDLARLAEMLLNGGIYRGRRIVRAETVALFTKRVDVPQSTRTLGWETPPGDRWAGSWWSEAAFGHTGNTGTALWIDPKQDVYVILLTNSVLARGNSEAFLQMRREVCDAALKALQQGCGPGH